MRAPVSVRQCDPDEHALALFAGEGEARALARVVDWGATALGPVGRWPEALRTTVRVCLASPTPLAVWAGAEFTLLHNDAYLPFLGAKAAWAMGRPAREVWAEIWAVLGPEFEGVYRTGEATQHEETPFVLRRHGHDEEGFFTFTVSPIADAEGRTVGLLNVSQESTRSVRAAARLDEELREASQRLLLATSAAAIGVFDNDLVTGAIRLDERARELVGYEPGEVPTEATFRSLLHPDDGELRHAAIERALDPDGDHRYHAEYRLRSRRGGGVRWLASTGQVSFAGRRPVRIVGVLQDVTEVRRTELELRRVAAEHERQVRLFEGVASTTPDFVYLFDLGGRFLYANRRLLEVWGVALHDAVGKTPRELGYEQWHHDMHMREIAQVVATKAPIKGEVPFRAPLTGIFGVYEYIFTPVIGADGAVDAIAGTTRDVTERKRAEEELRRADRQKAEFLAVLSHELRNPLAPIRNSLHLLDRAAPDSGVARRAKEVLNRQVNHLTRLVDDLLDATRISRGKMELQRTRVDLREVVRRTTDDLLSLFDGRDLALTVEVADREVPVDGDPVRLSQVLGNLLHNAAKFTPAGGKVTVALALDGDAALLSVRDTGEGIEPADIERMFAPFEQGSQGVARTRGGLGLGLALVRGFVEMHGGSVRAESAGPGRGAFFEVRLPLAPPDGAAADPATRTPGDPPR